MGQVSDFLRAEHFKLQNSMQKKDFLFYTPVHFGRGAQQSFHECVPGALPGVWSGEWR
jgi:hypothetical protein